MKLYTNWFSPFARKVALVLDYKGIAYEAIDGLHHDNHDSLKTTNTRGEVPALVDGDITIVNSSDILAYLDHAYPEKPIYPSSPAKRVKARAIERLFDSRVDAILVDCSLWLWTERPDAPMIGLKEKAQRDLESIFLEVETLLDHEEPYMFGKELSLAEFSLWPHMASLKPLGFELDADKYPKTAAWLSRLKKTPLFQEDAIRTIRFVKSMTAGTHETKKVFWRGDRIEWILSRGFHDWFLKEIKEDRVIWPD